MRVLVLYAHPNSGDSVANAALSEVALAVENLTFVDVYAEYAGKPIDIQVEQQRLLDQDVIIFQFPVMWYSTPPLLKEWQDLVLEEGFAYGENGNNLKGKILMAAVTAGSSKTEYCSDGNHDTELRKLLSPLQATAKYCQMQYLPPYTIFGTLYEPLTNELAEHAAGYRTLLHALQDDTLDLEKASEQTLLTANSIPINNT